MLNIFWFRGLKINVFVIFPSTMGYRKHGFRVNNDVNFIKQKFDRYLVKTRVSYSPCFHYKGKNGTTLNDNNLFSTKTGLYTINSLICDLTVFLFQYCMN